MEDYLPLVAVQDDTNELGTLHHNTISRKLETGEAVVEPRPTLAGNTKVATGDYGRGVFVHRNQPLYVSEQKIATSVANTDITAEINPNASASFGILNSGSNRITLVQNAGYDQKWGNIYYATDSNNFQINTYEDTGDTEDISARVSSVSSIFTSPDGLKLYALDNADTIYEYDFGTAERVDTLSFKWSQTLPVTADPAVAMHITSDGLKLWILTNNLGTFKVQEIVLTQAWAITSMQNSVNNTLAISGQVGTGGDLVAASDDETLYVVDTSSDDIFQYDLTTAADLSTASYASKSLDLSSQSTSGWDSIIINPAGTVLHAADGLSVVYEYTLSTPWDLSTGSYASRNKNVATDLSINLVSMSWATTGDYLHMVANTEIIRELVATDTFTKVTDADSPGAPSETVMVRGIAVLNGVVYAMDSDCKISNSGSLNVPSWGSTDFISAERKPDYGCYIGTHHDNIIALNTRSLEFFYDAGNATNSPLARRQDIYYNVGCVFPNSVVQLADQMYFFGTNEHGDTDIYVLNNYALQPLGNEYIKKLLRELDTPVYKNPYTSDPALFKQTLVAYATPDNGVCLNMTINGKTYNYNTDTGLLSKWYPGENVASATGLFTDNWNTEEIMPITSIFAGTPQGSTAYAMLSNGYTTGFAYNSDLEDIGGSTAPASFCYLPKWNAGSLLKKKIVRCDLFQYPSYDTSLDPSTMTLQWVDLEASGDYGAALTDADFTGGQTFSGLKSGSRIYRCGTTRERVYKFTFTPAKSQLVGGLKLYFEVVGQ